MSSLKQQISLIHTKSLGDIKGTQPAMGPCWPGHYLLLVEKRLLQPKLIKYTLRIHSRDTFRNLLQSCLVFNSILDLWMIPSFRANFYPSCNIILPASMQRNKKRIDLYKCATSDFGFAKKKKKIITITAHFLGAGTKFTVPCLFWWHIEVTLPGFVFPLIIS